MYTLKKTHELLSMFSLTDMLDITPQQKRMFTCLHIDRDDIIKSLSTSIYIVILQKCKVD